MNLKKERKTKSKKFSFIYSKKYSLQAEFIIYYFIKNETKQQQQQQKIQYFLSVL